MSTVFQYNRVAHYDPLRSEIIHILAAAVEVQPIKQLNTEHCAFVEVPRIVVI
jgi:hypothetical protein